MYVRLLVTAVTCKWVQQETAPTFAEALLLVADT